MSGFKYTRDGVNSDSIEIYAHEDSLLTPKISRNRFEYLLNQIEELSALEDNWDRYGAVAPLTGVTSKVSQFVPFLAADFVEKITDIFPNPHGTVTIEWENRDKEIISLEIGLNNFSYFVKCNEEDPKFIDGQDIMASIDTLTEDLDHLFRNEIRKFIL
jgi:hypothetical protein